MSQKILLIVNDPPYGSERAYNALRLANNLLKQEPSPTLRIFFVGDGAANAKGGQSVPQGYYNINSILRAITKKGGEVGVCGTCMDARGLSDKELLDGTHRSTLDEMTEWTLWADKVIVF